jgi:hypothetical protein
MYWCHDCVVLFCSGLGSEREGRKMLLGIMVKKGKQGCERSLCSYNVSGLFGV